MGVCWLWGSLMVLVAGGKCWVSGHQPRKGGTWVKGMKERLWGHPLCASTGLGAGHRCLGKSPVLQRQSSSSSWYSSLSPTAFHLGTPAVWGGFEVCKMGPCSGQLRQWCCWGGRPEGQAGTLLVSGGASPAPWVLEAAGGCRGDPCFLLRPDQRNLSSNTAREALRLPPGVALHPGHRPQVWRALPPHPAPPEISPSSPIYVPLYRDARSLFVFPFPTQPRTNETLWSLPPPAASKNPLRNPSSSFRTSRSARLQRGHSPSHFWGPLYP